MVVDLNREEGGRASMLNERAQIVLRVTPISKEDQSTVVEVSCSLPVTSGYNTR